MVKVRLVASPYLLYVLTVILSSCTADRPERHDRHKPSLDLRRELRITAGIDLPDDAMILYQADAPTHWHWVIHSREGFAFPQSCERRDLPGKSLVDGLRMYLRRSPGQPLEDISHYYRWNSKEACYTADITTTTLGTYVYIEKILK